MCWLLALSHLEASKALHMARYTSSHCTGLSGTIFLVFLFCSPTLGCLNDRSLELLLHLSEICLLIFASVSIGCILLSQRLGLWPLWHHPALTVTQTTLEHLKEISRNRMPNTYFIRLLELYNERKSLLRISKNNIETHHKPEILFCCWSRQCQVDDGKEQLMCMRLPSTVSNPSWGQHSNPTKSWSSKSSYQCSVKCDTVEINYLKSHT